MNNLLQETVVHLVRHVVRFQRQFIVGVLVRSSVATVILMISVLISLDVLRWDDGVVSDVVLVYATELLFLLEVDP